MSNIIKSFRVIESDIVDRVDSKDQSQEQEAQDEIIEKLLEEARVKGEEIISKAEEEANKIIESAHKAYEDRLDIANEKAKKIYQESKDEGYDAGYEMGLEKGYKEGYEAGYKEGKEEANKLIEEALCIKNEYIKTRSNLLKELEQEIIQLVIAIYEKVIYKKVEEDEELIVSLIANGIDNLEVSEKLTIIVSKEDYEMVNRSKDIILAKASLINDLEIRVNSNMEKGDCILETSKGSVDVSIKDQLKEVKELLISILSDE
ncbi:MAG: hypothetical protein GXY96_08085 [Tissierellia bacterium]|nr:hypothetical protein [Tissierellia bacterium]